MEDIIRELLKKHPSCCDHLLEQDLANLAAENGDNVYQELFRQLTGKRMSIEISGSYWRETLEHRNRIEQGVKQQISLRAALLDLLGSHHGELTNPVIIEADHLENLRLSSITDGLTGLFNQTYFKNMLYQKLPLRRRIDDNTCALILLDLDRFKQYNDRCGHLAGDDAIRSVSQIIREQIREHDVAARYGGEEFAVFLPNAAKGVAHMVADRIRKAVESAFFIGQELVDGKNLTISGGIAVFPQEAGDAKTLIELADKELYKAKHRRNSISPSNYERRKDQRHPTQSLLEFSSKLTGASEIGIVYDLSDSGIGLWSNLSFAPQEEIRLIFKKPFWTDELELDGSVRQVFHVNENDLHFLGIQFEQDLRNCTSYLPTALTRKMTHH